MLLCFSMVLLLNFLDIVLRTSVSDKPSFTKKQPDLFFPPYFANDFHVSMQISQKYGLIYVITKQWLLFVYDLETATAVYRNDQSRSYITTEASTIGGFYAINRQGQVLLATVNEATIIPFINGQLNNLELAVNLAKRGNLPGAENLTLLESEASVAAASKENDDKELLRKHIDEEAELHEKILMYLKDIGTVGYQTNNLRKLVVIKLRNCWL
ncbi:hypothetical protein REPUB_Repub01dG0186100 [Reevesia pubescens]